MNELWGFVDTMGKEVVPLKYDEVKSFSDGLAAVKLGGKWGYIDNHYSWPGKEVIPLKYSDVEPFSEGLAAVKL